MQRRIMGPVQETLLAMAAELVGGARSILDVGCGTGRLLRSAAGRFPGATLVGVDPAGAMINQAKASLPPGMAIRFEHASAESLPLPDGQFELVFSTMSFHHWADQKKGIGEVSRVLAPGGRWLLADIMPSGLMVLVVRLLRVGRVRHPSRLRAMLAEAGLEVVTERNVPGMGGAISVLAIAKA